MAKMIYTRIYIKWKCLKYKPKNTYRENPKVLSRCQALVMSNTFVILNFFRFINTYI